MRWKQFFTPVKSIDTDQARDMITGSSPADLTILDVRQPGEYESGHIPGAKLIPLPDLGARIGDIDETKPTIVY
jgi:rhodanese-related sulfurtransferase